MAKVHKMVQAYMEMFVSRSSKEINGAEFAKYIHQMQLAEQDGFLTNYDRKLLERII